MAGLCLQGRLGSANCFSGCIDCLADFFLALIHRVFHLTASVPNGPIGGIYAIQAFIRNPFSSFCPGLWSQKYAQRGPDPKSCDQVSECRTTIVA